MDKIKKINNNKPLIVLATGGTGGHIFPAINLARSLINQNLAIFVVTDQRYFRYQIDFEEKFIHSIEINNSKHGIIGKFNYFISLLLACINVYIFLSKIKPNLVVGFGGYPSLPTLIAAKLLNIKIILHEQNSVLGKVNRLFAKDASWIATGFKNIIAIKPKYLKKAIFTGNPIKDSIIKLNKQSYPAFDSAKKLNLLVIGGSQGAKLFGQVIPKVMAKFKEKNIEINLIQQCLINELDGIKSYYQSLNIEAELAAFFPDLSSKLSTSHLVISRAGAMSIAELIIAKRPAILVPLANSIYNHQQINANYYIDNKLGWLIKESEFEVNYLLNFIENLINNPNMLLKASLMSESLVVDSVDLLSKLVIKTIS